MSVTEEQIERIVREVLASLPAQSGHASNGSTGAAKQLSLSSKVITLAQLAGRTDGITQIVVRRGAIVTPAARDFLKEKQIAVAFDANAATAAKKTKWQLACATAETTFDPAELLRATSKDGVTAERIAHTGLTSVVSELADRVSRGGLLGLLFTGKSTAAVCLANRQCGVRAASAACHVGVRDAVAEIGLNFLVINPRGKSTFQLGRMIHTFHNTTDRVCPAEYTAQLK